MLRIFQNAKRLISVCLATLLIVVSTITIFPSTASAAVVEINGIKCESGSNCSSEASYIQGLATGAVIGSVATAIVNGQAETIANSVIVANTLPLISTATAMGEAAVAAIAPLTAVAGSFVSAPIIVPVAATAAVGYGAYQLWHSFNDNHSQNAN